MGQVTKMKGKVPVSEFMVPASDQHGHSVRIEFRIHPDAKRMVGVLLATMPETGWKTESEFGRYAVRVALERLSYLSQNEELTNTLKQIRLADDVAAQNEAHLRMCKTVDEWADLINRLQSEGAHAEAKEVAEETYAKIAEMDDERWRSRWLAQMERRFGQLLEDVK